MAGPSLGFFFQATEREFIPPQGPKGEAVDLLFCGEGVVYGHERLFGKEDGLAFGEPVPIRGACPRLLGPPFIMAALSLSYFRQDLAFRVNEEELSFTSLPLHSD